MDNPYHLALPFERFGHALVLCHLGFEPGKHFFRVRVDLFEIDLSVPFIRITLTTDGFFPSDTGSASDRKTRFC